MSKKGAASKWNGGRARYDEHQIEDDRIVKKGGRAIRVQDEVTEVEFVQRRKEGPGFHRGARVSRR